MLNISPALRELIARRRELERQLENALAAEQAELDRIAQEASELRVGDPVPPMPMPADLPPGYDLPYTGIITSIAGILGSGSVGILTRSAPEGEPERITPEAAAAIKGIIEHQEVLHYLRSRTESSQKEALRQAESAGLLRNVWLVTERGRKVYESADWRRLQENGC